ncbi:Crp/Fnr family transcriptional regulator [Uliginosibacterium sp. H1]|uniref:Crp/Fnr family transcriptional regulator n=1 Tax=Uliginosibacterium sp. H1 TaxID=3114757 RepID=UPI002E17DF89|nr:Crp/Fnr family transcriptional regulator [Uliginosibacterium sp. H1]
MSALLQKFMSENIVLREAGAATRARLAELAIPRRLHARQILFQHGDRAESIYLVLAGKLSICLQTLDGRQLALNLVTAGSLLGEIAVLDGGIRSASAIALSDCSLAVLRREDFLHGVRGDPALAEGLIRRLCGELRRVSERVADAGFLDVQAGLAQRLLESARDGEESEADPRKAVVVLSQEALAQSVGVSRVTANKHLNAWQRKGWVALARSRVTVLDAMPLLALIEAQLGGSRIEVRV